MEKARRERDVLKRTRAARPFSWHRLWLYSETGAETEPPDQLRNVSPTELDTLKQPHVRPHFIHHTLHASPPRDVAFASVCNDRFAPGLEALLLSLHDVYPDFSSDFIVLHDGSLSKFSMARLRNMHEQIRFLHRNPDVYDVKLGRANNHRRIGKIGFLSLEALQLSDYRRIVLLDSDLLVLDDISPLWALPDSEDVRVVADCGARPFAMISSVTARPVFNSGIISMPQRLLGHSQYLAALEFTSRLDEFPCEMLDKYVDQRFWNLFLRNEDVTYLPTNFNVNKALIELYYPEQLANVSVLHLTGPKPWYSFLNESHLHPGDVRAARKARDRFPTTHDLWLGTYKRLLGRVRKRLYQESMGAELENLQQSAAGKRAVLIGNGPSLASTDLGFISPDDVTIAFNWFILSDLFDTIRPDHLVLASHMLFGGWHTTEPEFPPGFLDCLRRRSHRPSIWTSFYFQEFIESSGALDGFSVNYFLFEKPFKEHGDVLGYVGLDLDDFLTDNRTGVLTAGVPLAVHLGCQELTLVGCDSSYGTNAQGDYFYDESRHTSLSTRSDSLHRTWEEQGPGRYCFLLAYEQLRDRGTRLRDATVGAGPGTVPKISVDELLSSSKQQMAGGS